MYHNLDLDLVNVFLFALRLHERTSAVVVWCDRTTSSAERGFALDLQDDLWARNSLSDRAVTVLEHHEAEVETVGEVLTGHIENQTDAVLLLVTPSFRARLPRTLSHEDYTLMLVSLPDSDSTALLHRLYINNANLDPPRYELKVGEVTHQEEVKVKQLVTFMMESFVTQGKQAEEHFHMFRTDYRKSLEGIVQNKQLLAHNTVVLTSAIGGENRGETTTTLGAHNNSSYELMSSSSRPHSPFVSRGQVSSGQQPVTPGDGRLLTASSSLTLTAPASTAAPSPACTAATSTTIKPCSEQQEKFHDVGTVIRCINSHCPQENIVQMLSPTEANVAISPDDPAQVNQTTRCFLNATVCSKVKDVLTRLVDTNIQQRQDGRRHKATGVPMSLVEELVCQTQYCRRLAQQPMFMSPSPGPVSPSRPLLESVTLNNIKARTQTVAARYPSPVQ
ncbi:hypothetical protein ElyMa_000359700 [Elysia marginata]|uniref:SEFIR domain-containing protein n=1 Tax=Elysia marginata TaxID=1093978 RepID=A0AAV4FH69_9GAST|nr:hypothetical protein ElyMa_000359700 [Elysia marginata]